MLDNLTHRDLDRPLAGGYKYEWRLAAEIAVISLIAELKEIWSCQATEIPIFWEQRKWLKTIKCVRFDCSDTHENKEPTLEDINLIADNGRELLIQVKSGKKLVAGDLQKVLNGFINKFKKKKDRRFLLISENGITEGLQNFSTLKEAFAKKPKKFKSLREILKTKFPKKTDRDEFLSSVTFSNGPLIERVITSLRYQVSKILCRPATGIRSRQRSIDACRILLHRLEDFCVSKSGDLTQEILLEFIERPVDLKELGVAYGLLLPPNPDHSLYLLNELYGWQLENLDPDFLKGLVDLYQKTENSQVDQFSSLKEDVSRAALFSVSELPSESEKSTRQLLSLRRLLALLGKETASQLLESQVSLDNLNVLTHLWLTLDFTLNRDEYSLTLEMPQPPFLQNEIKSGCEQLLNSFNEELGGKGCLPFRVLLSGERIVPDWFPTPPSEPPLEMSPTETNEDESEPETLDDFEKRRQFSAKIDEWDFKVVHRKTEFEESLAPLEEIQKECKSKGYSELERIALTTRCHALESLGRKPEAVDLLLDFSIRRLEARGCSTFATLQLSKFKEISPEKDTIRWYKYKLIEALLASLRADFRMLESIITEVDKDEFSELSNEKGLLLFKIRLAEMVTSLIHKSADAALRQGLDLLERIDGLPSENKYQLFLHLAQSALWSESFEHFSRLRRRIGEKIEALFDKEMPTELEQSLVVTYSYLKWLHGDEEERQKVSQEWSELQATLKASNVWQSFQFTRDYFENRRGIWTLTREASRLAAVELKRSLNLPAETLLQSANQDICNNNWTSAFRSLYQGEFVALRTNDWRAWCSLRKLRPKLWLADGRFGLSAFSFIQGGVVGAATPFLRELVEKLSSQDLQDVFDESRTLVGFPQRKRAYDLFGQISHLVTTDQREAFISDAEETLKRPPEFREEAEVYQELYQLMAHFFRCPSSTSEGLRLTKLLLKLYSSSKDDFQRLQSLRRLTKGFWTSTGYEMPEKAALEFLEKLISENPKIRGTQERQSFHSIFVSLALISKFATVKEKARQALVDFQAEEALSELDARSDTVSPEQVQSAFEAALRIAQERIEKSLEGMTAHVTANHINDVAPFIQHMTQEQRTLLLESLLEAVQDPMTEAIRRWDALQLLRDIDLYVGLKDLKARAISCVWDILEGRGAENEFDAHRRESNRSYLSAMTFDPEHESRVAETASQALGVLYALSPDEDTSRFFSHLSACLYSGERAKLANSLICYFEAGGEPSIEQIPELVTGLLSSDIRESKKHGLHVLYKWVKAGGRLGKPFLRILRDLKEQTFLEHDLKVEIAKVSRLVEVYEGESEERNFLRSLNDELKIDANPIVKKHAQLGFWKY